MSAHVKLVHLLLTRELVSFMGDCSTAYASVVECTPI